jgi:hypothetical protein
MYISTQTLVVQEDWLFALLAYIQNATNPVTNLEALEFRLYQNDYAFVPTTVVGDLTEADFTGYAFASDANQVGPIDTAGSQQALTSSQTFIASNPITVTNTIYGYYVTKNAGVDLVCGERFPVPIQIQNPGEFVGLNFFFPLNAFATVLTI